MPRTAVCSVRYVSLSEPIKSDRSVRDYIDRQFPLDQQSAAKILTPAAPSTIPEREYPSVPVVRIRQPYLGTRLFPRLRVRGDVQHESTERGKVSRVDGCLAVCEVDWRASGVVSCVDDRQ